MANRRLIFALQSGQAGIRPAFQLALANQILLAIIKARHSMADQFGFKQVGEQVGAVAEAAGILIMEGG